MPPTVEVDPDRRSYYLEIFLVSFAGLLLEISYTRIVSFKLFYYYTYLVIGLALLGHRLRRRARRGLRAPAPASPPTPISMWGLVLGAVSVGVGYLVVAVHRRSPRSRSGTTAPGDSFSNLGAAARDLPRAVRLVRRRSA